VAYSSATPSNGSTEIVRRLPDHDPSTVGVGSYMRCEVAIVIRRCGVVERLSVGSCVSAIGADGDQKLPICVNRSAEIVV
jgi:hypothetical protein